MDTPAERFRLLASKGIAAVIKSPMMEEHLNPLAQATLIEECRVLAKYMGATMGRTFEMYGLHDEQLLPTRTTLPASMEPPKAVEAPPAPKKDMRKFEGTFLQGGEGATGEFEMLAPRMVARLIIR